MNKAPKSIHTHLKDCPDHKEAAADRASHEALRREREMQLNVAARAEWFGTPIAVQDKTNREERSPRTSRRGA